MSHKFRYGRRDLEILISEGEQLLFNDTMVDNNENNTRNSEFNNGLDKYVADDSVDYTIEKAVEYAGFGYYQIRLIAMIGVISAADAMEMMLLSVLGPALQCEWHLTPGMKALITTIVFIGFLLGSFFFGMISDNYGRKTTFLVVITLICYMGLMTAFSPSYVWLILCRGMVGFGIGGTTSSFTLLSEFLPMKSRAKVLILYQIFWALGSTFEVGLAYLVLPNYGWRWLVGLSSVPIIICAILITLMPESPRYLLGKGRVIESQLIIDKMFRLNKKPKMQGHLISSNNKRSTFDLKYLFMEEYRCTLFLLLIIWFGVTFCYYGIVLINSEYFNVHPSCHVKEKVTIFEHKNTSVSYIDRSCCENLTDEDYKSMIISSFGEFFIIPINFFLADLIGRKITISSHFLLASILFVVLYFCMPPMLATIVMFGIRGFTTGIFNLTYIYTSEVFPTSVRSTATGLCSSFARLAAILTPFVAQVFIPKVSFLFGFIIYASLAFICFISAALLPIETRGRPMPQNFGEIELTEK